MPHTPDSWWEIEVAGDQHGLRFLRAALPDGEITLDSEDGRHLLRIPELDGLPDVGVVRSRARSYVESLSGAAKLILGWNSPLQVGNILRRHPDGHADYFLEVDSARMEIRSFPVTLRVTHPDGTVEERGPGHEVRPWLEAAKVSEPTRRVLRLISERDLNWVELYRIMEIIHGAAEASIYDWVSKGELRRFKHTANSVGAVGDDARHGHEPTAPPKNPMTLKEATNLVSGLAREWLNAVSGAD